MIKNVIFDLGRVIINFDPDAYIRSFNFNNKETEEQLMKTIFLNDYWNEFDRGSLTLEEGIELMVLKAPNIENEIRQVLNKDWSSILTLKEESAGFLKDLKKEGFNIYILSNFSEWGFKFIRNKYDFFDYTDGMVISYEVKMIKPEPEIYETILKKYGLVPEETVFIDDMKENINAAKEFGIKTILFTSLDDAKREFELLIGALLPNP